MQGIIWEVIFFSTFPLNIESRYVREALWTLRTWHNQIPDSPNLLISEQFLKILFHGLLWFLSKMRWAVASSLALPIWCFCVWRGWAWGAWVCLDKGCIPTDLWCWRTSSSFQRPHLTHLSHTNEWYHMQYFNGTMGESLWNGFLHLL